MNLAQSSALTALMAAFLSERQLTPVFVSQDGGAGIATVSNYAIADSSAIVVFDLPDFPPVEIKKSGKFALPTIRSYQETGTPNLLAYPDGIGAMAAALWGDKHVAKQNGIRLRKVASQANPTQATGIPANGVDVKAIAQAQALATV